MADPAPATALCTRVDIRGDRQVKALAEAALERDGAVYALGSYWLRGDLRWRPPCGVALVLHPCPEDALRGILRGVVDHAEATLANAGRPADVPRSERVGAGRVIDDARALAEKFLPPGDAQRENIPQRRDLRKKGEPDVRPVQPGTPRPAKEGRGPWRDPSTVGLGEAF